MGGDQIMTLLAIILGSGGVLALLVTGMLLVQ
jgi:hypothetical protein